MSGPKGIRSGDTVRVTITHPNTFRRQYEIDVAQFTFTPLTIPPAFSSILGISPTSDLKSGYTLKTTKDMRLLKSSVGSKELNKLKMAPADKTIVDNSVKITAAIKDVDNAVTAFYEEVGRQRNLAVRYYEAVSVYDAVAGGSERCDRSVDRISILLVSLTTESSLIDVDAETLLCHDF
ncbi:MAG: hypothetical protein EOO77_29800 [Oxalobacteraceae bacterium]|nr:MAG: hypothetical protein EOO77_29800 [Oxalobacteraceae bacterium]